MEIGEIISNAVKYPSYDWKKVIILGILFILSFIIIGIFFVFGYYLRIVKSTIAGIDELPEFEDWGNMFIDGLKVLVVNFIYLLIPGIIIFVGVFTSIASLAATNTSIYTAPTSFFALIGITGIIGIILALIFALFAHIAIANMALNDEIGAAFRFNEIRDKIKMIGWGKYITWYIFMLITGFVVGLIASILNIIPLIGTIIALLVIYPYFVMFYSRSLGLIFVSSDEGHELTETEPTD
ncbi:DUF4013 domain-containing protein [Methanobacterium sp.]|uniref:DUF4013 domain-containing protein n=1 Tax=Methanobacterium sp. TaxID=2164 RepID=UPI003C748B3B